MKNLNKLLVFSLFAVEGTMAGCTQEIKDLDPTPVTSKNNLEIAGPFTDFAVGYDDGPSINQPIVRVFALGKTTISGGHPVFELRDGNWIDISNGQGALHIATQRAIIDVTGNGSAGPCHPVIVDSNNKLLAYTNGSWRDVFIEPLPITPVDLAIGSGQYFILDSANVSGGHPVYTYDYGLGYPPTGDGPFGSKKTSASWKLISGTGAVELDVARYNVAWVIDSSNRIFYSNNNSSFTSVPGQAIAIGAGVSGDVAVIAPDRITYRAANSSWIPQSLRPTVTRLDIDANGKLWYLDNGWVKSL